MVRHFLQEITSDDIADSASTINDRILRACIREKRQPTCVIMGVSVAFRRVDLWVYFSGQAMGDSEDVNLQEMGRRRRAVRVDFATLPRYI